MRSAPSKPTPFHLFTLALAILAVVGIWVMTEWPAFVPAALIVGAMAFAMDFVFEFLGVRTRRWKYDMGKETGGVPILVPVFFAIAAVLATLAMYILNAPEVTRALKEPFAGTILTLLQFIFLALGVFFLGLYFARPRENCLAFGLLPLALSLYVEFNQPWMLLLSLMAVYVDYFIEGPLIKRGVIEYHNNGPASRHLVALTYFATTLLLLGVVGFLVRYVYDFPIRTW